MCYLIPLSAGNLKQCYQLIINNWFIMGQNCCGQMPDREFVPVKIEKMEKTLPSTFDGPKLSLAAQSVQKSLGEWKPTLSFERGIAESAQDLSDGTIYVGQWKDNKPHGLGKMYLPDQSIFTGCFVEGVPTLQGRMINSVGVYYEGGILNSQAHGSGKLVNKFKKYQYEGTWKEDLPHGQGKQTWGTVSEYQGEFQNGMKNGEGEYHRIGDYLYVGEFKNNQFSGKGIITFNDGQIYAGQWENGEYNGYGSYTWVDKSIYQGNFLNGKKDGLGKYSSKDGQIFQGNWKCGKREGQGRLSKEGQHLDGIWVDDKLINRKDS